MSIKQTLRLERDESETSKITRGIRFFQTHKTKMRTKPFVSEILNSNDTIYLETETFIKTFSFLNCNALNC